MTLTGMKKHVGVLEQVGLVTTEKVGRVRTCALGPRRLDEEAAWLEDTAFAGPHDSPNWTALLKNSNKRRRSMNTKSAGESAATKNLTTVEQKGEIELVVTRTVNAPVHLVWLAWTQAELFRRWWVPKSYGLTLVACEMDVRVGGKYRLEFSHQGSTMEFFGVYREVTPHSRLVWTNEEGESGETITTVTFEEKDGKTLLVISDLYPSKEAMDTGSSGAMPETLDQLEAFLETLAHTLSQ